MKISQSLIKEIEKNNHCPKQIYYSFVEGKELIEPSEAMLMGRYFESELLGACRGGEKQPAKHKLINIKPSKTSLKDVKVKFLQDRGHNCDGLKVSELDDILQYEPSEYINGEKLSSYLECDELVSFAKDIFNKLGIKISAGKSQVLIESELLSGNVDHINVDINDNNKIAYYDVKWTATKEDDRWNGWAFPEDKHESWLQAIHYCLIGYEILGYYPSFYFMVFGKDKWVKVLRYRFNEEQLKSHKHKISYTAERIREYHDNNYTGKGNFNKCIKCPFLEDCDDSVKIPEVEVIQVD